MGHTHFIEAWQTYDGVYKNEAVEEIYDLADCLNSTQIFGYTIAIFKIRYK